MPANFSWLAFGLGLLIGALTVGILHLLRSARLREKIHQLEIAHRAAQEKSAFLQHALRQMEVSFQAHASRALQANSDELVKRANEQLQAIVHPLHQNLTQIGHYVRELEEKRAGDYRGLQEQIRALNEAHLQLQQTTGELASALKSSRRRGRWGELQLRRVVELADMLAHVDFDLQAQANGQRPDMLIHLPNQGQLPVDAKAPLDAYLRATATNDPKEQEKQLAAHAQALRRHIQQLASKSYWQAFERAPQFVVLFLPSEAMLSAALQADPKLLDYAMERQVMLTSPVTLLALLKTVGWGWMQNRLAENARAIARQGKTLYQRLGTFSQHLADLHTHLGRTVTAYNKAIGSLETRLAPAARRLQELGLGADEPLSWPPPLDVHPRTPNSHNNTHPPHKGTQ